MRTSKKSCSKEEYGSDSTEDLPCATLNDSALPQFSEAAATMNASGCEQNRGKTLQEQHTMDSTTLHSSEFPDLTFWTAKIHSGASQSPLVTSNEVAKDNHASKSVSPERIVELSSDNVNFDNNYEYDDGYGSNCESEASDSSKEREDENSVDEEKKDGKRFLRERTTYSCTELKSYGYARFSLCRFFDYIDLKHVCRQGFSFLDPVLRRCFNDSPPRLFVNMLICQMECC